MTHDHTTGRRLRALRGCLVLLLWVPVIAAAATQVLVESGSSMRYLANNSDPMLTGDWTKEDFIDTAWSNASYGVGYETRTGTPVASNLLQSTVPSDTQSVYTRASFTIADVASVKNMVLGLDYDDGVIAWWSR